MIVFNWLGMGMLMGSVAFGYLVEAIVSPIGKPATLAASIGFVTASVVDGVDRWKNNSYEGAKRFFLPSMGGHIAFIPLWAMACLVLLLRPMIDGGR